MKEYIEENSNIQENEDNNFYENNNEEEKEDVNKENQFEIIDEEEIKKIKFEEKEMQNNLLYFHNLDENLFPNSNHIDNDIDKTNTFIVDFFSKKENTFTNINPLRKMKRKYFRKENNIKSKKMAIKELVSNLKTQYIIYNIKYFLRQYYIKANPYINQRKYKIVKKLHNISLYIYGVIMFFEKPWFCFKETTVPLPSSFHTIDNCEKDLELSPIPFIYDSLLRIIEIVLIISILITKLIKYNNQSILKNNKLNKIKQYKRRQIILFFSILFCFFDLLLALITNKFPIINFIMRPIIYIYLLRRLRLNWLNILKVLWKTKIIYLFLLVNILTFTCVGYFLFNKNVERFKSLGESFLQLYILLTTCNFPDIMLDAMKYSKLGIFYFISFIIITILIVLSFLKSYYTNKYYNIIKKNCFKIIKDIIQNSYNQHIFNGKKFYRFILNQKRTYSLTEEEFDNILILFNLYNKSSDKLLELSELFEKKPEKEIIKKHKIGKLILDSFFIEIIVNLLCFGAIILLASDSNITFIFHFIITFCLCYEPLFLILYLGIKRFAFHHIKRMFFHLINLCILILLIIIIKLFYKSEEIQNSTVLNIFKIFTGLRTIRIFILLDKFKIIKNIYDIIRVSKEMLYSNLLMLYSFFFIFSTLSILLTGGNIKKNSFENLKDSIPFNYEKINFNDFASSYIACFCLMMINNLNILVNSLTYNLDYKLFYQLYFATFYFFSTLIIINIIQTLLLEMYILSDNSSADKKAKKKKREKGKERENSEENKDKAYLSVN